MSAPAQPQPVFTIHRTAHFTAGFPLALVRVRSHAASQLHSHDFSELVVVLRGTGLHITAAGDWPIGAGDVFVLHGDEAHGYQDTSNLDLVNILFDLEELGVPRRDVAALPGYHVLFTLEPLYRSRDRFASRLRLAPDELRQVATQIDRLADELDRRPPGWQFAASSCFTLLLTDLSRRYTGGEDLPGESLHRLGRVISHLELHYAEPVTLDDLAAIACTSRRTLTRLFRDAMGDSPGGYLTRLRLRRAVELLEETDASVTEVAFQVGFRDSNYFARQFRAVLGRSPSSARARAVGR